MSAPTTTEELLAEEYNSIEYAHIKLYHEEKGHYEQGRIVGRFQNDLKLHYRGYTTTVNLVDNWTLRSYAPVRSTFQRRMIEDELEGEV